MCNAANHPYDCDCGFGGDTGGGRCWGSVSHFSSHYAPPSFGWSRDIGGTVESYVNPNAHCPVCSRSVFFYRSPYNGRVFFDDVGWPWPKHGCTDNRGEPRRATRSSIVPKSAHESGWHRAGWTPLLSPRVAREEDRCSVRGDLDDAFVDLLLPTGSCLASDPGSTKTVETLAFDRRLVACRR